MLKKSLKILLIVLATCIIGLLNWYDTPTMSDDLLYHFIWNESQQQGNAPLERIQNLSDVVKSQIAHYQYINGRSLTHGLAQIALNLIPQKLAKLLNSAMFLLLVYLMARYTRIKKENLFFLMTVVFGLIFLVISGFYSGFIWLLGAFTYLWALVMTMCFLFMLRWLQNRNMNWKLIPLIPLSFLMGWTHEAIALPLSVACFLYLVIHRNKFFFKAKNYCMLAYILGMLMIVISPALWNRADVGGIPLTQRLISGLINILFGIRISWILIISLLFVFIKNKQYFLTFIYQQKYLFTAWIIAIGIIFSCGTNIERVPICTDFIAILILLNLLQTERIRPFRKTITIVIALVSAIVVVPAIQINSYNHQNFLYHHQQLCQTDNNIIKVRQLPVEMSRWMNLIAKRYHNATIEFGFYNCYMAFDKNDINTKAMAKLYHKEYLIFLPEDVIHRIDSDSSAYNHLESDQHNKLYIKRLKNKQSVKHITFVLGEEVPLKFYQRPLSYPGYEYELDDFNYKVIHINQNDYLIMTIPTSNIKRRIKYIRIQ